MFRYGQHVSAVERVFTRHNPQAELAQPERQKQMTVRQLAQVQKAITTRSKAHLTRYEHDKLRLPNGAETTGFRIEFRPWPEGSRPQPVGRGDSRVPNDL